MTRPPKLNPDGTRSHASRDQAPSRLDAGTACEDCGKWLPGERRVCGRCYVKRDEVRR